MAIRHHQSMVLNYLQYGRFPCSVFTLSISLGTGKTPLKTVKGVITFCNMARIETIYERSCECKLKNLWEEWRGFNKGKDKAAAGKVDDFKKRLNQLCDVGRQTH